MPMNPDGTDTPDYTDKEVESTPKEPSKTKSEAKGVAKALAGGFSKGSGGGGGSSAADKTNAIADKATQQTSVESTPKPGAIQGATLGSFKHGGVVPKTGPYKLHEGETVIPARQSLHRHAYNMRKGMK